MPNTRGNSDTSGGRPRNTRAEVARRAGVSVTTVSLVLNGRADELKIAPATRERVLAAARDLRYVPNAAARALAGSENRTIGLIIGASPELTQMPVVSDVVLAAVRRAQELGYFVLLVPVSAGDTSDPLTAVRDASIAGLICEARGESMAVGLELEEAGIPLVWIRQAKRSRNPVDGPRIEIDEEPGVAELAAYLWDQGVRSVHLLAPDTADEAEGPRLRPMLKRFGSGAQIVECDDWTSRSGRAAAELLLATTSDVEAVFAGNDLIAAGALHACRDADVDVPGRLRLAGFGDFPLGPDLDPPLTTVAWPLQRLAEHAVDSLVHQLRTRQPDGVITLSTKLIVRSSA